MRQILESFFSAPGGFNESNICLTKCSEIKYEHFEVTYKQRLFRHMILYFLGCNAIFIYERAYFPL